MLDIKLIREKPEIFNEAMQLRGEQMAAAYIIELDADVRNQKNKLQDLQNQRNQIAKQIGVLKSQKAEVSNDLIESAEKIKIQIPEIEQNLNNIEQNLTDILLNLPNYPHHDVPFGVDESDNIVVKTVGIPKQFDFTPKHHSDLGEALQQMHFEKAAKISGARFVVLEGDLALMERALANFMLDLHTEKFGYQEVSPPYMVRDNAMLGTGQLPKFGDDSFQTTDGYRLIPTAEVPLTNLVADEILDESALPLRFTAHTPCFRSEAGSAGRDTKGMLRQHQFHKVELVSIVAEEMAESELERMVSAAEEILKLLEIPYRISMLCSQDMGFSARKTYDIEVWMPGQNCYREISSCSNCGDFQARRMKARYRDANKNIHLVHTLNGSALAIGRTMIAIIENYQLENGDILIPKMLQPYMKGKTIIKGL